MRSSLLVLLLQKYNPNGDTNPWTLIPTGFSFRPRTGTPTRPAPPPTVPQRRYITINGQRITVNGREIYLPPS